MRFPWMVFTLLFLLLFIGCSAPAVAPDEPAASSSKLNAPNSFGATVGTSTASKSNESEMEGEVEGEGIPLDFFGFNEFDTYEVEIENGEVDGDFSVEVFDPGTGALLEDAAGEITCVTFEQDGRTARLGGESPLPSRSRSLSVRLRFGPSSITMLMMTCSIKQQIFASGYRNLFGTFIAAPVFLSKPSAVRFNPPQAISKSNPKASTMMMTERSDLPSRLVL